MSLFSSKLVDDQRHISLSLYNLWMKKVMPLTAGQLEVVNVREFRDGMEWKLS